MKQIPYWEVKEAWKTAAPMVQKAIDKQDEWTLDSVYQALILPASNMQLWLGETFALVTQIQRFPSGKTKCLLFLCGGEDLEAIKSAQSTVENWAKEYLQCSSLIIYGRKGWAQTLEGFKENMVIMEKQL